MPRGGKREESGRKNKWKSPYVTKTIRVPAYLADEILKIAYDLDSGSSNTLLNSSNEENSLDSLKANVKSYQLNLGSIDNYLPVFTGLELDNMCRAIGIEGLYYITHVDNIASILENGILSHALIESKGIDHQKIYNANVINKRAGRVVIAEKTLWDFANVYFQPRNPMMYVVDRNIPSIDNIAILLVSKSILNSREAFVVNGNAASLSSEIISTSDDKFQSILREIRKNVDNDWWKEEDGTKRKIMAECLIPNLIEPKFIEAIYTPTEKAKDSIFQKISLKFPALSVVVAPEKFFRPISSVRIGRNISLIKGDMFFSKMQTLTISVNCVGVMGKGLASTAKNRFPDVYVRYQEICKNRNIKLGKPVIYKRESSILSQLGEEGSSLSDIQNPHQTWFLLFPTKDHWKNNSELEPIEAGLKWFVENYKSHSVTSIAFPALGCGNGNLSWKEVGPLMCKYLSRIDISVSIYLPNESNMPPEWMTSEFLIQSL
jgi:O-acetyl-ADP-ribose deacetylase (regulator of RNase III)